ncbi:MAG: DUF3795 domain-containing protein [Marinilabiliales bacterium]|nr:DUF3795 domain-containing protein [Marinilabiliales bacterium]
MTEKIQEPLTPDVKLVAKCGLYCGSCRSYLKGKCPGCANNEKASWCEVRKCNLEHQYNSCADCTLMPLEECKKYNAFIAKAFGFIFNSDRAACIRRIREIGPASFALEMAVNRQQTIRRR